MRSFGEAIRPAIAGATALRERWRSGVSYNPLSVRTVQDPYPLYAALRARSPVHRSTLLNAWLFTRHSDVDAILRDHRRLRQRPAQGYVLGPSAGPAAAGGRVHRVLIDPLPRASNGYDPGGQPRPPGHSRGR